jgi:hypothetical protein
MVKRVKKMPKALKGDFKQVDTLSTKATMGNPKSKASTKARDKRLEKASV